MTYDTRKTRRDQEFVEEIELQLDACKYSNGDYVEHNRIITNNISVISDASYNVSVGLASPDPAWDTVWGGSGLLYGLTGFDEILSFEINSNSSIEIKERGLFGTTAHSIPRFTGIFVKHLGEVDGSCRGFPFGCNSADSYDANSKLSLKFSTAPIAGRAQSFAGLNHGVCKHDAGEVDVGESIGTRAKLKFSLKDQGHNDIGVVPYADKRSQFGTIFGKLLARHPYFQGRTVIYREGLRDPGTFGLPDFIERSFIIDDARLDNDVLSITALDPLILTEDKKAKMPVASPANLATGISAGASSLTFANAPAYYFGAMSSSVFVRIDSEVLQCTVTGSFTLGIDVNGYRSTEKDHEAGASIQDCISFAGTHGIDSLVYALENYTKIPAAFIDDYSAVSALLPGFLLDDALITKPVPVVDFINTMVRLGNLIFNFDEVTQKIVIDYIPELEASPINLDGRYHLERDTIHVDPNIKNQFTRFSHLWGPVDITKESEENFAIRFMGVNLPLESDKNMGEVNEKKAFANMYLSTSSGDSLLATTYVDRVLRETNQPPKIVTATVKSDFVGETSSGNLTLGSIINLIAADNQDQDGKPRAELYQVLKLSGNAYDDYQIKMRRYQSIQPAEVDFVIDQSAINYVLSDFFAPPSPGIYTIYIEPGVIIGSNDTAIPAFTTGVQASGVELKIINRGRILGMGGDGGDSGIWTGPPSASVYTDPAPGLAGGDAFDATVPCQIDNGSGLIWAGGAGKTGEDQPKISTGPTTGYLFPSASGGGGGQGFGVSAGGLSAYEGYPPTMTGRLGNRAGSGNQSGPGAGGEGDGAWGSASAGVLGGIAIRKNGNTVTIISGDNDANIKGRKQ